MANIFKGNNTFDRLPPGTKFLIVASFVVFLIQMVLPPYSIERLFALQPLNGEGFGRFWPWQLLTYSFLHGNGFHLFINMFILWMFGLNIEGYWGTRRFLVYYFVCVVGAGLTHLWAAGGQIAVGASGGIYGILLAFGFLFPDSVIYLFFVFPLRAMQAVLIMGLLTLAFAMNAGGSKIAHFAHLGGMLTGLLYFKLPALWGEVKLRMAQWRFTHPKTPFARNTGRRANDLADRVDRILEKISRDGVDSLTPEEHDIMRDYAQKKK